MSAADRPYAWERIVPMGWWAVCLDCGGLMHREDRCPECWEEAEEARHDGCCPYNADTAPPSAGDRR